MRRMEGIEMKSATELLAEMLALHADPQKGAAELYLWLHHRKGEVKEAVERGDDSGRLDWLEESADEMIELSRGRTQLYWGEYYSRNGRIDPGSLRGAIDRARGEGE